MEGIVGVRAGGGLDASREMHVCHFRGILSDQCRLHSRCYYRPDGDDRHGEKAIGRDGPIP
jgi:hypothetical protein